MNAEEYLQKNGYREGMIWTLDNVARVCEQYHADRASEVGLMRSYTADGKRKLCEVIEKKVNVCWALGRALEDYASKKGLRLRETVNLKTMEFSTSFVELKSGEFAKKGIVINFCPFCGGEISQHLFEEAV